MNFHIRHINVTAKDSALNGNSCNSMQYPLPSGFSRRKLVLHPSPYKIFIPVPQILIKTL